MKWLILALLLAPVSAFGQTHGFRGEVGLPEYGSFEMKDSSGLTAGADFGEGLKSFRIKIGREGGVHYFSGGVLMKEQGLKDTVALRFNYTLALPLIGRALYSETSLATGYLGGKYLAQGGSDSQLKFDQILYGYRQQIGSEIVLGRNTLGAKAGWQWAGARQEDTYGTMDQWDNYGMSVIGSLESRLHSRLGMRVETEGARKRYNPDRYFFTERWTEEYELRSRLVAGLHPNLDVIPLLNYRKVDIERDGRADLARAEYGVAAVFKFPKGVELFGQGIYAPWRHKEGSEKLLSAGVRNANFSAEVFRREKKDVYSTFTLEDTIVGLQFAWKFGDQSGKKLKSVKDYGYAAEEKYRFYLRDGNEDNRSLGLYQQAERLSTLRLQNEWAGSNLQWERETFWDTLAVYDKRSGDCDQQQCMNNVMHTRNGYKTYLLGWWDFGKSFVGHATGIIRDPHTGEWFWQEYGMIMKVAGVGVNDSPEQIAAKAIRQNHRFSALPVDSGSSSVWYSVIDCSEPDLYIWPSFINLTSIPSVSERPRVEYGTELFTGRDFLFDYR